MSTNRPCFFEPLESRRMLSAAAKHLVILPTFDAPILNDANAAMIEATINKAIAEYESIYATPITVKIEFTEGDGLGSNNTPPITVSYASYLKAFAAHVKTADQRTALATLQAGKTNPVTGGKNVTLTQANARALGFRTHSGWDGTVTLTTSEMNLTRQNVDPNLYDLQNVTEHEIDEVLGMGSNLDGLNNGDKISKGYAISPEDLFRYAKRGGRSYTTANSANSYFSIDAGRTHLARFNQNAGGDFGDWFSVSGDQTPQVQDAFGTPGGSVKLGTELTVLDVIGWDRV
jgi:hypothetical protein